MESNPSPLNHEQKRVVAAGLELEIVARLETLKRWHGGDSFRPEHDYVDGLKRRIADYEKAVAVRRELI